MVAASELCCLSDSSGCNSESEVKTYMLVMNKMTDDEKHSITVLDSFFIRT